MKQIQLNCPECSNLLVVTLSPDFDIDEADPGVFEATCPFCEEDFAIGIVSTIRKFDPANGARNRPKSPIPIDRTSDGNDANSNIIPFPIQSTI